MESNNIDVFIRVTDAKTGNMIRVNTHYIVAYTTDKDGNTVITVKGSMHNDTAPMIIKESIENLDMVIGFDD